MKHRFVTASPVLGLIGLIGLVAVSGCAAPDPDRYRNQPIAELCLNYLTYPSANIYQSARATEIARRGEDCTRFADLAAAKLRADDRHDATINSITRQLLQTPSPVPPPTTQTYIINGKMVTCTTMGTVTNCF